MSWTLPEKYVCSIGKSEFWDVVDWVDSECRRARTYRKAENYNNARLNMMVKADAVKKRVIKILNTEPLSVAQIAMRMDYKPDSIRTCLYRLVNEKKAIPIKRGHHVFFVKG